MLGELQNLSDRCRDPGNILLTFYDAAGRVVGQRNSRAFEASLTPGRRTVFRYVTQDIPPGWVGYKVIPSPGATSYRSANLETSDVGLVNDQEGRLRVVAKVTNNEMQSVLATVYIVLYDRLGLLNAYQSGSASLAPGESRGFEFTVAGPTLDYTSYWAQASAPASYGYPDLECPGGLREGEAEAGP